MLVFVTLKILHLYCFKVGIFIAQTNLPFLTSGVGRLLYLPSAKAASVCPKAHCRM